MTQFTLDSPINPNTKSGTQLADDLSGSGKWRDALQSLHKGSSRPSYATAGMLWVDDSDDPLWRLYMYDGSSDILISEVNATDNTADSAFAERFGRFALLRFTAGTAQMGTDNIYSAIYGANLKRLVIVGQGVGSAPGAYSDNGRVWTAIAAGQLGGTAAGNYGLAFSPTLATGAGRYVAVGTYSGAGINGRYSTDAITWTAIASGQLGDATVWDVVWSPGLSMYVAVGAVGTGGVNGFYSSDGITWTAITAGQLGVGTVYNIDWGEELGLFVAVGTGNPAGNIFYSSNGTSWTTVLLDAHYSVAYSSRDKRFIVGRSNTAPWIFYSSNGADWTTVSDTKLTGSAVYGAHYCTKLQRFVIGDGGGAGAVAISRNGEVWERVISPGITSSVIRAIEEHSGYERAIVAGWGGQLSYSL